MGFLGAADLSYCRCVGRHFRTASQAIALKRAESEILSIAQLPGYTFLEVSMADSESDLSRHENQGLTCVFDMKRMRTDLNWEESYFMPLLCAGPDLENPTIEVDLMADGNENVEVRADLFGLGQERANLTIPVLGGRDVYWHLVPNSGIAVACNGIRDVVAWIRVIITIVSPECDAATGQYMGLGSIAISIAGLSRLNERLIWGARGPVDAEAFDLCWRPQAFSTIRIGAKFDPNEMGTGAPGVQPEHQDFQEIPSEQREWMFKGFRIFDVSVPHFALLFQ